jgi:hypothetical protein
MNTLQSMRVEWNEDRSDRGAYRVIAEWNGVAWEFWEKDAWEIRWYPMEPSPTLIAKAEILCNEQRRSSCLAMAA